MLAEAATESLSRYKDIQQDEDSSLTQTTGSVNSREVAIMVPKAEGAIGLTRR
jgi:hypothetical protein